MAVTGLEKITEKILAQARAEADAILAEANAEAERIRADYASRVATVREQIAAESEHEGIELISRAKSASANRKRDLLLETQSRLIDEVFEGTLEGMKSQNLETYTDLLVGLLTAALSEQAKAEKESRELYGEEDMPVFSSYEVLLNARDRERCGVALIERVKKGNGKLPAEMLEKLVLAESTASIDGGLILRCGNIEANCSLSLLFAQLREELETEVCRVLFDADRRA
ncbi:MAG: hypothetical protein E7666_04055 [Ruminococcaceae bacterium]|nr:hypothetical protein [Oscillospiraceae bacterium]